MADDDLTPQQAEQWAGNVARRLLSTPPQPRLVQKRDPKAPKRPRGRPRKEPQSSNSRS